MAEEGEEPPPPPPPKCCLVVLSSVAEFPDGSPTGFWLSEPVEAYETLIACGWEVGFASITGTATVDASSVESASASVKEFWEDEEKKALLEAAPKLSSAPAEEDAPPVVVVDEAAAKYDAVLFAGGYAPCWDFPDSAECTALVKAMYGAGKVVSAVCHGPLVLAKITGDDEAKLIAGKEVTGFTNTEEAMMGKYEMVSAPSGPGSCYDLFYEAGAIFKDGGKMESNVAVSGNLITGQNANSVVALATEIVYFYDPIKKEFEPPRLALLAERETLVSEIKAAKQAFEKELAGLKKQEASGGAVADKIEMLQLKATAGRDFRAGVLADIDSKLERNALMRQAAIDKAVADAAAAAEE